MTIKKKKYDNQAVAKCVFDSHCPRYKMLGVDDINKLEAKIEELKAENERLKENYIKLSQQKDLDSARWVKRCTDLHIEDKSIADKYWLTLQEIKKYCEKCKDCVEVGDEVILYTIIQKINKVEDNQ